MDAFAGGVGNGVKFLARLFETVPPFFASVLACMSALSISRALRLANKGPLIGPDITVAELVERANTMSKRPVVGMFGVNRLVELKFKTNVSWCRLRIMRDDFNRDHAGTATMKDVRRHKRELLSDCGTFFRLSPPSCFSFHRLLDSHSSTCFRLSSRCRPTALELRRRPEGGWLRHVPEIG